MSQENVELAQRAVDAFNRRDLDALLELMDNDVQAVPRLVAVEGGYHGHDGIRRWWKNLLDVFPDWALEVLDEVRDVGDLTVVAVRARGHGAGSDAPLDETLWQIARRRSGKCTWWGVFTTQAEALEAAGLGE